MTRAAAGTLEPMKLAVLPFNTAEGIAPAIGRQLAAFVADVIRDSTEAQVSQVNFLVELPDQNGRVAHLNLGDGVLEEQQIRQLFDEADVELIMDGVLRAGEGGGFHQTVRFHRRDDIENPLVEESEYPEAGFFEAMHSLVVALAREADAALPEELVQSMPFGTDNAKVFINFLIGYDALRYIQQANGQVTSDFDVEPAAQALLEAIEADKEFESPYMTLLELCRQCATYQVGKFETVRDCLRKAAELVPEDYRAHFVLGEIYGALGDYSNSADELERSIELEPTEPALYARLGMAQMSLRMPVNAERNFRKAMELEGEDKPSAELLANVLAQTNRVHEVPVLWKELMQAHPQNAMYPAKYGMALIAAGNHQEALAVFESALETLDNPSAVKRVYASVLAQQDDVDRAMDFYEDWLDENPTDSQALLEYAQTLQKAGREFEIPDVLRNVLATEPEQNTRAQVLAWLIELEQPKRAETVENAEKKLAANDVDGALRDLKPMKNWLADYWKLWALLATAYNKVGEHAEAEDAARRVITLYPRCEPAYGELLGALSGQNKHEEAYQTMRWAAQHMPQSLGVFLNLGLAAKRAGHTDEARNYARQIREAIGPNNDIELMLAEIEA